MVTNKTRKHFLTIALKIYAEQTYINKVLIIINHSPEEKLIIEPIKNVHEFLVDKTQQNFTLGQLRNIALDGFVPEGGLWTTNDDDDYKHPTYLEEFIRRLTFHNLDLLFLKNRLEINLNNGFIFRSQFKKGWAFFIAKKYRDYKYLDLDTMEDKNVRDEYKKNDKKIATFNNDPNLYIRTIHNTNTSIFVVNTKNSIVNYSEDNNYREFDATYEEKKYVNNIIDSYYKDLKKY